MILNLEEACHQGEGKRALQELRRVISMDLGRGLVLYSRFTTE